MSTPLRLALAGAAGRMGRAVLELACEQSDVEVVAALTDSSDPNVGKALRIGDAEFALVSQLESDADALIDFTVGRGTMAWLPICRERKIAMVIGATGHSSQDMDVLREVSQSIPIVYAPNCSLGIQAIRNALSRMVKDLGEGFDVEIVEAHHRKKIDAPSGTALSLAREIADAKSCHLDDVIRHGRQGTLEPRPADQIGVHALRMGDLMSHHEIHFSGPGETVTLKHTAHSRSTFAAGALRAAQWAVTQQPGFYGMGDVLR